MDKMEIRKVVLVDDEPDIRRVGELSLRARAGWQVVVCASGTEAVESARRERPDVILLDVMMPVLDGPATLALLRADAETASIPVIFMTAKVQRQEVERYLSLGAAGVVSKPFDPLSLVGDIRKILGLPPA